MRGRGRVGFQLSSSNLHTQEKLQEGTLPHDYPQISQDETQDQVKLKAQVVLVLS